MKKTIVSAILGLIGGIGGAFIFEPIDGLMSILLNDFTIGGIIVGIIGGIYGNKATGLPQKLGFSVLIGLLVFLVFAFLSGQYVNDLIAGGLIGLLVGLASHFVGNNVSKLVDSAEDKIEERYS